VDPTDPVRSSSISSVPGQTSLYCLRPEDKRRLKAKVLSLLNSRRYEEAARIMVASAIVNTDPNDVVQMFMDAAKEYSTQRAKTVLDAAEALKKHGA